VSQAKHWCRACKVWTGGHASQIKKHNDGVKHIENEKAQLIKMKQDEQSKKKEEQDVLKQLAEIERAAQAAMDAQFGGQAQTSITKRAPEQAGGPQAKKAKPEGKWTKHIDPNSQCAYYYNETTKESSWVEPPGFVESEAVAPAATSEKSDTQAPPPWITAHDAEGRPYYYNPETGVSQWTMPESPPAAATSTGAKQPKAAAVAAATPAAHIMAQGALPKAAAAARAQPQAAGSIGVTQPPAASLPAQGSGPWKLETDPASGSTYFFNTVTGQSQWDRPADFGVDLSKAPPPPSKKPPPPPARGQSDSGSANTALAMPGGWEEVSPEESMFGRPEEIAAAEGQGDDEDLPEAGALDQLIELKNEARYGAMFNEADREVHEKEFYQKKSVSLGAGEQVSFGFARKKASGIRRQGDDG